MSPHDARCPECGQVVGSDNVCQRCHALAPALRHDGRLLCTACDGPRARLPNTVVVSARELRWRVAWERLRVRVYKTAAVLSVLFALFVWMLMWAFAPDSYLLGSTLSVSAVTLLIVTAFWLRIARVHRHREARERFMLQQRLLGFASKRQGPVSAADVARHLGIPTEAADSMLDDLVRTGRADMDVTERGEIKFSLHAARQVDAALPRSAAAQRTALKT